MKHLTDATEIVEVLGGPQKVAELTCVKNSKVVWNWYGYFDAFPPNTYAVMIRELGKHGYTAHPSMWKQRGFEKPKIKRAA